jgi:hypothetical protein
MKKRISSLMVTAALVFGLSAAVLADTIRLKDGSVIHGQVIGFKDQQFIVLVGAGARGGRRSQIALWMEDVESIEFDNSGTGPNIADNTPVQPSRPSTQPAASRPTTQPTTSQNTRPTSDDDDASRPSGQTGSPGAQPSFFQINSRVRGDNAANGWTNSGLVVRRGQRIRVNARGNVTLGAGRVSTPAGLTGVTDTQKLMGSYPTGALIAVIGDDNDDFIFIGQRREFIAQRDGVLFLGVNEGNLNDNTGAYDVVIEAEAMGGTR